LFINIALLPKELVFFFFSSYCFETVFHIKGGTEAEGVEEDILTQEG
jgi:hypothetical protein